MKVFGPKFNGYNLQESGNYFMDNIIYFHNLVLVILFFISILVSWFLFKVIIYFMFPRFFFRLSMIFDFTLIFLNIYKFNFYRLFLFLEDRIKMFFKSYEGFEYSNRDPLFRSIITYKDIFNYIFKYTTIEQLKQANSIFKEQVHNHFIIYYFDDISDFLKKKNIEYRYYFYSDVTLEFLWTLFPTLILLLLAIPSFALLFSVEKVSAPELTVKVIGHQWYWEYQYMDYINYKEIIETCDKKFIYTNKTEDNYIIESYMLADDDLEKGQLRLLEVDKKLILPSNTSIRLLITSDDVLHSWAVPSLGIKVDACPGRLNEIIIKIRENGIFYGQCSELCGWYHGFMPIVIQTLSKEDFKIWAMNNFLDIKYCKKDLTVKSFVYNKNFLIDQLNSRNKYINDTIEQNKILIDSYLNNNFFFFKHFTFIPYNFNSFKYEYSLPSLPSLPKPIDLTQFFEDIHKKLNKNFIKEKNEK